MRDSKAMYEARMVRVQGVHKVEEGMEGVRKRKGRERVDQVWELGRREGRASGVKRVEPAEGAVEFDPLEDEDEGDAAADDPALDQLDPDPLDEPPWYCLLANLYHRFATLVIWT